MKKLEKQKKEAVRLPPKELEKERPYGEADG